jgi:hypothetical protein
VAKTGGLQTAITQLTTGAIKPSQRNQLKKIADTGLTTNSAQMI